MAQWNPFFGVPNQDKFDEQQSISSPNIYNAQQLAYASAPIPQVNYNGYYLPNHFTANYGGETVYNVQDLEAHHIRQASSMKNASIMCDKPEELLSNSKLTPTAAEFKPGSSTNYQLNSQTFYGKSQKSADEIHKGAIRKHNSTKGDFVEASSSSSIKNTDETQKLSYGKNNPNPKYKKYDRNAQQKRDENEDVANYVKPSDNKFNNGRNYKSTDKSNSFYDNSSISKYIKRENNNSRQAHTLDQQNESPKLHKLEYRDINFANSNLKSEPSNNEFTKTDTRPVKYENSIQNETENRRHNKYENRNNKNEPNSSRSENRYNKYDKREQSFRKLGDNRYSNESTRSEHRYNRHRENELENQSKPENRYKKFENRDTLNQNDDSSYKNEHRNNNKHDKKENCSQNDERPGKTESRYQKSEHFNPNDTRKENRYNKRENDSDNRYQSYRESFAPNEPKTDARYQKFENRDAYSRNYRNAADGNQYQRDNYNRSNQKSYRTNNRYDKTYENWRSTDSRNQLDKPLEKEQNDYKDDQIKDRKDNKKMLHNNNSDVSRNYKALDDVSQRDRLTEQVNRGTLECLVCCERVRQTDKIWNCRNCYHIFHLRCITKWGNTSKDDNGWRCPACQHTCTEIPTGYYCYCGKAYDPQYIPGDTAHGCGDMCARLGVKLGCAHRCTLLCHPGPCPKCEALVSKHCNCGATTQMVKCSAETILICTAVCSKLLNCGVHKCTKVCHGGDCDQCLEIIDQECFCGHSTRTIPCNKMQYDVKNYSCESNCGQLLTCGNHQCKELCHPETCPPCVRAADQVQTCPCGKSPLEIVRVSCLDAIPSCGKVCGKRYTLCGTSAEPHVCKSECHEGDCSPCPLSSFVRCRCGHMSCEIKCSVLNTRTDDARCEKRCTKKRSCAKHKCNQLCCIDIDHICPLPCNHMLTCGQHRCEQTCHKGRCQPCWRTSFEELYCECGANVIYPPVPCGTKRPACARSCKRTHDCSHEALHTCHNQPECPPCTVLTTKVCYGGHEKRSTIPCHQKEFSCGLPCGKELACGKHKCLSPCHRGACLKEGQVCVQACTTVRSDCEHACGLPCHHSLCPESPCRQTVKVTCQCGLRSSTRACVDMSGEYQRIATSMLASKMADMQLSHSVDIGDIIGATTRKTLKTLDCNDECRLIERNRRLAIGLQIRNPDLSAKLTPRYSDFMRQWAKKDSHFCQLVHDKLTELVQLAKQSKQKSRSYSFPSMNRDKRQFVHEYCEHFGCESAAYDSEPNRNVVGTAVRDRAWLPSCSLLELIQRESGQRKVPGPILNRPLGVSKGVSDIVSLKINSFAMKPATTASVVAQAASISTTATTNQTQPQTSDTSETIDYFNFPPLNK